MKLTRRLVLAFVLGLVLTVAADVLLIATGTQKAELWASSIVSYWAALGFLSFVAIVVLSKLLGDMLVTRSEDYYQEEEPTDSV